MTTQEYLARWRTTGAIGDAQFAALSAIVRKERFTVFLELNALLYLGVIAFVAGVGFTVYEHFANLGDAAIVIPLALLFGATLYYCFTRAQPYRPERCESPTFAFDYVLYLGCLVFAVELGYVEFRFHLLRAQWDLYLLASALLYFALCYRFDNRFVLSLALSTLAAWFGVRLSLADFHLGASLRTDALVYAGLVAAAGWWTHRNGVKQHFLETYLHVAVNTAFVAMVSGAQSGSPRALWTATLIVAAAVAIERGVRFKRFVFVAYGAVYGYIGISVQILRGMNTVTGALAYLVVSSVAVIFALVTIARRFGREE